MNNLISNNKQRTTINILTLFILFLLINIYGFCLSPISYKSNDPMFHLYVLKKFKCIDNEVIITNLNYDEYGYLKFDQELKNKQGKISFSFANSVPFSLDGSILDILYYIKNEINPLPFTDLNKDENHRRERLRYLAFKRLVKYRQEALPYLNEIINYLSETNEPSSYVREEVAVAVRMISDENATISGFGRRLNIYFTTYECKPLIKIGGLGDVAGPLPRVMTNKMGHNAHVVIPFWSQIDEILKEMPHLQCKKLDKIPSFYIDEHKFDLYEIIIDGTPIYLLKCDDLFKVEKDFLGKIDDKQLAKIRSDIYRKDLDYEYQQQIEKNYNEGKISLDEYGRTKNRIHPENALRAMYFSRASIKAMEVLSEFSGKNPDIINNADWQTGLIAPLIDQIQTEQNNKYFAKTKVLETIHNLAYKGLFDPELWKYTGLNKEKYYKRPDMMDGEAWGSGSLMKMGIVYSDRDNGRLTVSPQFANEIKTEEFGSGFNGLFQELDVEGIINGISRREIDPALSRNFAKMSLEVNEIDAILGVNTFLEGKHKNKISLMKKYGLEYDPRVRKPLIGFAGRLSEQKGIDILIPVVRQLLRDKKAQFIFTGAADPGAQCKEELKKLMKEFPGQIYWTGGYIPEEDVLHLYAGLDLFAMPSLFEPCGIAQLIAMRFGTVTIANPVGGLVNTIFDFDKFTDKGNGFCINSTPGVPLNQGDLLNALNRAINAYSQKDSWIEKAKWVLKQSDNFSWENSADLFERLLYRLVGFNIDHKQYSISA
ncbi:MAG: hypothetical protein ACD_79C00679G0001 [uncultured bacterium]|nr:MAG: hypothetical protein ACD_79C00679G0001 [uncultured bacterium]